MAGSSPAMTIFLVLPGVGPQLAYPLKPAQSNKRLAKDSKDKLMNILPGNMRFGAGQPVRRLEDQRLLTGKGQFIDDRPEDGARASANPESRDSPMCNCTSGVRCFALRCANWRIGE